MSFGARNVEPAENQAQPAGVLGLDSRVVPGDGKAPRPFVPESPIATRVV